MRISDWSSDVCSSDLPERGVGRHVEEQGRRVEGVRSIDGAAAGRGTQPLRLDGTNGGRHTLFLPEQDERSDRRSGDRQSVVEGKGGAVRVELGCRRLIKKKNVIIVGI